MTALCVDVRRVGAGYTMNPNPKHGCDRSFCLRMKSTLTKRGVHVKSSGYRVSPHVLGSLLSVYLSVCLQLVEAVL